MSTMTTAQTKGTAMMGGNELIHRAELQIVEEALAIGEFPVYIDRPRSTSTGHLRDANHAIEYRARVKEYLAREIAKKTGGQS
jgi:hypothetical protein